MKPHSIVALAVAAALAVGCSESDRLETAPVTGQVTYNGKPVPTGSVMFVPEDGGPSATGEIDTEGYYTLQTYEEGDGAIPGRHKVVVTALQSAGGSGLPEDSIDGLAGMESIIPDKYSSHKNTDLVFTVEADKENTIDLKLK